MKKKSSNLKYLGYGFAGGAALAAFAAAISGIIILSNEKAKALILPPSPAVETIAPPQLIAPPSNATPAVPLPTFTFTFTPTYISFFTPTDTATPPPTATLSPAEQKLQSGELSFAGKLSAQQQMNLYNVSIQFAAATTQESKKIGEQIAGKGYGSPTLICGPLSIAILQRAGIITPDVAPIEFWLLNPFLGKDRALLNRVFPKETFDHHVIRTAINKIDYKGFPLHPGDFLYLKDGTGGNFEHMLVVNRVDSLGRAYSVTNHYTENGFIISEVMLYDPFDPSAGIFKTWTRKPYAVEGATGFGGFELWRRNGQ